MDVAQAIKSIRPGARFVVGENEYNQVSWHPSNDETTQRQPTLAECEAAWQVIVDAEPMKRLRKERDERLAESDLYAIADYPHGTDTVRQAWFTYRQALRDLPTSQTPALDSNNQLTDVAWPVSPTA
tara:strand:+ start:1263 stop:1643 length:381 start_codon:yes stop_codon:yes gene_type:complete